MNYSNSDYGNVRQQDPYGNMPQRQDPYYEPPVSFTPEEQRVFRECMKEGIFQRALPMGLISGLVGLFGARAGPLMSSKFGVKPAVIGLGTLGFFFGRLSYGKVCVQRVLDVPDGNFRKILIQKGKIQPRENMDEPFNQQDPSNFYATVDVPKDQNETWDSKRNNSDIEMSGTSSFDTVPSDYYAAVDQTEEIKPPSQSYTSYDDLRRKNRQEYTSRMYSEHPPRYSVRPDSPQVMRPRVPETPPVNRTGSQQTKYGDSWE